VPSGDQAAVKTLLLLATVKRVVPIGIDLAEPAAQAVSIKMSQQKAKSHLAARICNVCMNILLPQNEVWVE
jgi:hypothetical protein